MINVSAEIQLEQEPRVMHWLEQPIIYEINTWVWLTTLSHKYGYDIKLDNVPDEVFDDLAALNVDAIWLMGVWQRSIESLAISRKYQWQYVPALPDLTEADLAGSPYAIAAYEVDTHLGGRDALAAFREKLRQRGLLLVLDFVPNHVASDHHWVREHPHYIVQGTNKQLDKDPVTFYAVRDAWRRVQILAHGKDPHFPAWSDTAQLNVFNPDLREAICETLLDIASQCDGVRCDMAMLVMNHIFAGTWSQWVTNYDEPKTDFWRELIPRVKAKYRNFLFVAEAYWDMEYDLQQHGFDFTYDKLLYDRILSSDIDGIRMHIQGGSLDFHRKMIRFIENHDEPRAYDTLNAEKQKAAATLICTLPGGVLLHDGQFEGRVVKLPVQIGRQPDEPVDEDLQAFYERLLQERRAPIYQRGDWHLFEVTSAWTGNNSHKNLIVYGWRDPSWEKPDDYRIVVINLTDTHSQGMVSLGAWDEIAAHDWFLYDTMNHARYPRHGERMAREGLYIELEPYEFHIFRIEHTPTMVGD